MVHAEKMASHGNCSKFPLVCVGSYSDSVLPQISSYTFIGTLAGSMMASAAPDIAKTYGMMHNAGFVMFILCNIVARYHGFRNFVHDALNFLPLICTWALI
jgi:hypothetical protein